MTMEIIQKESVFLQELTKERLTQYMNVLQFMKRRYAFPIFLDHDNNSAALAEKLYGIGKKEEDFIFLGISNGIGSGIVIGGEVYHNSKGLAPELVVLGQDCVDWDDKYVKMLEDMINQKKLVHDHKRIFVKKAYFKKRAQLIGAAANLE